ncbi:MAG: methyltransferase domain-containing protein [Candidatus Omnitrophica bacterium]|nr:methyltransferase domain-containing protein [Candidatus Omnitrophota bacterium]
MDNLIKQDQDRLKLFKKYGYDITRARNLILTKAKLTKGKILEVGTGKGHMAIVLAKKGFKLTSIDLDRKAQHIAKISLKVMKLDRSVNLKMMNAERLQYKDNSFDSVISVNFIHHAKNPNKCLNEMIRVTRDKLIIADINKRGGRIMEKVHRLDGHSHSASKMSLDGIGLLLKRSGMKVKVYRGTCQTIFTAKKGVVK